ncbi:hypothetical protein PHISCL_01936 [Aspergillus sclerotialis]|uniref:Six-bladed beta-propeller n=1 Tax=Aspergillus sclerotialis TaxID=2070753 RepID=A0A3A2ZRG8_9EURO|nr:hypothetical protein PHISCL_01936 [Aspergillus sclerotialis]
MAAIRTSLFLLVPLLLSSFGRASSPNSLHPLQQIYQFPNGTWVENIAIRTNGNILVTLANTPELWEVISQPQQPSQARLIHHFPGAQVATGITELEQDVFAVATEKSVWRVDFNQEQSPSRKPLQIATISPAGSLNGMTTLNPDTGTVAIADSELGLVWNLDTNTGEYTVMLKDETMAANTDTGPLLGINGLQVHNGYVYYVNTPKRLFCRIPVDPMTGQQLGPREIISEDILCDDFAISVQGVAYLAGLRDNVVTPVFLDGRQQIVAGSHDSRELMSATSAAFGRHQKTNMLYITNGGETPHATANSTATRGGKVTALLLNSLRSSINDAGLVGHGSTLPPSDFGLRH